MARAPVMAAGGIVLRRGAPPLVAVVRQRKRNEWVLPKGKLDDGETPKEAAHREVLEETGHDVAFHEFLGTLVYQSGGRSKVVHFWRMEAEGGPVRKLMNDIKAVDWLTLEDALARLSREYERAFLVQVGPIALAAAGLAPVPVPEPATDDIDTALQTLTPAEAASVGELPHGLLQKVKAWLRGEA
ncbi:NUDIX hydrolase [Bradyrhizobium sp. Arg816]|uniref:NUDIX hydrolase n=1 Tax=Bradyrhizobium sp. Arg816 TaxID=2998491 RepID=UPI00249F3A2B|nr:NUDIX hydrolase [Bradyrhizobium sp. Arg816]MDI3567068.1 NUDIX hydrolase [Bradyrhizobium sp. Arg816]